MNRLFWSMGFVALLQTSQVMSANETVTADEKFLRVQSDHALIKEQAAMMSAAPQSQTIAPAAILPLPLVKTVPMTKVTQFGIADLGTGAGYLWGLDGTALDRFHYVDKLNSATAAILQRFRAPNKTVFADGSISLSYANGSLWVLNYLDDRIYRVNPANGAVLAALLAPGIDVTSGLGFDAVNLWYGEWDYPKTHGGALLRKISTAGKVIASFRLPGIQTIYDIAFANGFMWATARDGVSYYILKINPTTQKIVAKFNKSPCEYGLTLNGVYLWSADWCAHNYKVYRMQ